jgi:predicted phage gp36 major capsid-like protein
MGINLAGVNMIFRLQKQITKMQKEMNSLFKNAQKELNKESKGQERALKQTMIQLAELKKGSHSSDESRLLDVVEDEDEDKDE